jgi:hypothetical protein
MKAGTLGLLLSTVTLSACVPFPVHKTLQPGAQVTVLNQLEHPVADAEATLIANAHPYASEKSRATQLTGANGVASFPALNEWRIESFMLHGGEIYYWNWCVRKEGYATFFTANNSSRQFDERLVVRLSPGETSPCPDRFR